jgi:predicted MFS family arabinose efflux permease
VWPTTMPERDSEAPRPSTGIRQSVSLVRRNAEFRRLYVAGLVSLGGDWFLTVALFDVVLRLGGTAVSVALVLVAQELPLFVMSPVGGILADRVDRRRLVIVCDIARAGICVAFLLVRDAGDIWIAYLLLPALSAFSASFDPAIQAAAPNLVASEDLAAANSLLGSAWGTMLAVGAALGGAVVATLGSDAAFVIDAASFLGSAVLLWRIRVPFAEDRSHEHPTPLRAIVETGRYARRDHRVLALLSVKGGFGLAAGVLVLIPVFAARVFGAGPVGIGLLMGARGLGALIGPFLGRRIAGADDRRLFHAIGLALATFGASYVLFGLAPSIAVAFGVVLCAHLGGGSQWALSTYGLQRIVPDFIRGRIFSFDFALVTLTLAVSSLVAGWAADRLGPRPAAIGLGGLALIWAAAWWAATRGMRRGAGPSGPRAGGGRLEAPAPAEQT